MTCLKDEQKAAQAVSQNVQDTTDRMKRGQQLLSDRMQNIIASCRNIANRKIVFETSLNDCFMRLKFG